MGVDVDDDVTDDFLREVDAVEEAVMQSRRLERRHRSVDDSLRREDTASWRGGRLHQIGASSSHELSFNHTDPLRREACRDLSSQDCNLSRLSKMDGVMTHKWEAQNITVSDNATGAQEVVGQVSRYACHVPFSVGYLCYSALFHLLSLAEASYFATHVCLPSSYTRSNYGTKSYEATKPSVIREALYHVVHWCSAVV